MYSSPTFTSPSSPLHLKKQVHLVILDRNRENPFQDARFRSLLFFLSEFYATFELVKKIRWGPLGVNEYLGRGIFKKPGSTARISVFSVTLGKSLPRLEIVEVNGGYWWILVDHEEFTAASFNSFDINTLQEFGIQNSSRGWGTLVPKRHVMYDGCLKIGYWWISDTLRWTNIAMENGHRNSGFSLYKNGGSFHSKLLVHQRVCLLNVVKSNQCQKPPKF